MVILLAKNIYSFQLAIYQITGFFSRSDPTENDSIEGLRPNARGPGLVTFGVSRSFLLG